MLKGNFICTTFVLSYIYNYNLLIIFQCKFLYFVNSIVNILIEFLSVFNFL